MRRAALAILLAAGTTAAIAQAPRPIAELQANAKRGDPEAMFQLGEAYRTGTGVTADRDQALAWFKRAADQGDRPARDAMGMLLFTRGNRQEAMPLIEAAAARGDARALYILATARFNGDYVTRDWPRAYAEMSRAAELGLPQAKASLAQMEPYLLPADRAKADEIRATLAAVAPVSPSVSAAPPAAPLPVRAVAVAPRSAAPPPPADIGVPQVAEPGAPDRGYSLANATGSRAAVVTSPAAPSPSPPAAAPAPTPRPPIRPAPPVTIVGDGGPWRVQLGAYSSAERAETQWRMLAGKLPVLGGHAHVVTPGRRGVSPPGAGRVGAGRGAAPVPRRGDGGQRLLSDRPLTRGRS